MIKEKDSITYLNGKVQLGGLYEYDPKSPIIGE